MGRNMNFNDYQTESRKTAIYPDKDTGKIDYLALGLAGETGEVSDMIKKAIRDNGGLINDAIKENIKKEMGDILWYLAQIATELGLSFDQIATENLKKTQSRMARGKLQGSGDER